MEALIFSLSCYQQLVFFQIPGGMTFIKLMVNLGFVFTEIFVKLGMPISYYDFY